MMWISGNTFTAVNTVYLLLGSNIEPRLDYLREAIRLLQHHCRIMATSSIYETEAWHMPEGTIAFLNAVIKINTTLTVHELLILTQQIEKTCKRNEKTQNTSRTLDIDILLFNNEVIQQEQLVVPHPRLHLRRFTLIPLCEIAAAEMHPILQKTFAELLTQCIDICEVHRYDAAL